MGRMGQLACEPYDVDEGREYVGYLDHVLRECDRLLAVGRLPDSEAMRAFLDHAHVVLDHVRHDVAEAGATQQRTVRTVLTLTLDEHRRMVSMNESIKTLLEILEFRQAVQLNRTDAVGRVAAAIQEGSFTS